MARQASLLSFIKSDRKHKRDSSDDEEIYASSAKKQATQAKVHSTMDHGARVKAPMDLTHLPPIKDLDAMFRDLVNNPALKLKELVERLDGRKLRVATMCSGTESPLLALSMISPLVKEKYGKPFEVEHVFSCEIEPFKQAYIERNFSPPILFRDVCELGNDEATTAYGALVKVPGNVDILIAGTSCVDFSNLNNNKQQIDGEGESGATFKGMLSWVDRHRPTIVILENVLSAPWQKSVCPKFRHIGYDAEWSKFDTKNFYIPHTRQRGYMCAVDARANKGKGTAKLDSIPGKWKDMVKRLERPASCPIEAFLLPEDDPRIVRTRASMMDTVRKASTIDWARCEVRHRNARFAEEIGEKRPLTLWNEGGGCALPDFAWNDWAVTQPERVLDLMDISVLRYAVKGVDASYKTIVWNLSQNVDRIGYPKGGLSPCMTPTMIPYISNRGGPLTGYEALGMQGLPVDRLLLTRESEDNCMDLAGNAMSTTVVGSCIMAVLALAANQLKKDRGEDSIAEETQGVSQFTGEDKLVKAEIDLARVDATPAADLLQHAQESRRLCECEGRTAMTSRKIAECQDCGFTACSKCCGRPEHNFAKNDDGSIKYIELLRRDPRQFEKMFKAAVPMRLKFNEINLDESPDVEASRWTSYKNGFSLALSQELRFRSLKRQEVWTATWNSDFAELELVLDPIQPEWRLFAIPDVSLPSDSPIRALFSQPLARLSFSKTAGRLLDGTWDVCLPTTQECAVTLRGGQAGTGKRDEGRDDFGDLVPSWEMSLGLLAKPFAARRVWRYLDVSVDDEAKQHLDQPIDGRYVLHDTCGGASNSLHKHTDLPVFMFLDPKRCTTAEADYFVFSTSQRRYGFGETRPIIASIDKKFRQFGQASLDAKVIQEKQSTITIDGKWIPKTELSLAASTKQEAMVMMPESITITADQDACCSADALLVCKLPLDTPEKVWKSDWTEVDHIHERQIFGAVTWLTERLKGIEGLDQWMPLPQQEVDCSRCAPRAPEVVFGDVLIYPKTKTSVPRIKVVGVEDIGEASKFEQALKNRPKPFVTQLRLIDGIAEFRIGLNVASMVHLALSRLPKGRNAAKCSWRLDTSYVEKHRLMLPSFKKALENSSNRNEVEAEQPPGFDIPLRPEQLRSLTWMLRQESAEAKPFVEEEIVEALLGPLNWRAEARATREIPVLGGVLADEVGYGKTAITLGLIDSSPNKTIMPDDEFGFIPTKASLIVVPAHLIKQWPDEVRKFLGDKVRCIVIESVFHLKRVTVAEIVKADIVCVAGNLMKSKTYLALLGALAGGVKIPDSGNGGRYFNQMHAEAVKGLKRTVEDLKNGEGQKVWTDIKDGRPEEVAQRKKVFIQKKRMKGRAFREAKALEAGKDKQEKKVDKPKPTEVKKVKKRTIVLSDSESEQSSSGELFAPHSPLKSKRFDVIIRTKQPISIASAWRKISPSSSTTQVVEIENDTPEESEPDEDCTLAEMQAERGADMNAAIKSDPWELSSDKVKRDYKRMKSPVLEMFKFNRFVIDEYTYLTGTLHRMTMNMRSDRRWILSGTPPIEDFAAMKTISVFLGIELGINDIPPTLKAQRHWFNDFTAVEKFHSFRETKSFAWHTSRHRQADLFLKQFMRQNKAEIDEIPSINLRHDIVLPAAERAIYLELLHHLQAIDMNIKRGKKGQSDREKRIAESFGESQSAEEALLKRCAHFDYGQHDAEDNAIYECDRLVFKRTQQLRECEEHLHQTLWEIYVEEHKDTHAERDDRAGLFATDSIFRAWLNHMHVNGTSDADATIRVRRIISSIEESVTRGDKKKPVLSEYHTDAARRAKLRYNKPKTHLVQKTESMMAHLPPAEQNKLKKGIVTPAKSASEASESSSEDEIVKPKKKRKIEDDEQDDDSGLIARQPDWIDEAKRLFKDKSHQLKRIEKELVGRVKSLRFFEVVRDVQRLNSTTIADEDKPKMDFVCPGSNCNHRIDGVRQKLALKDVCVFSTCGHSGCYECLHESSLDQKCPAAGCFQPGILNVIVRSTSLGEEEDIKNELVAGKHWGTKLEQICDLIKSIPKDEKVILFCQFKDLTETVDDALNDKKIPRLRIQGSASAKSKALLSFQNPKSLERVLVLNVADESASGANLTVANHVIFVSPLLCDSFSQYVAQETQAIGRIKRYGQKREVKIHRFLTSETIDTEIFEKREMEKLKFDKDDIEDW